jgi:head-tail adaptor
MLSTRGELNSLGVNPGQLRHRITLLEQSTVTDAAGVSVVYAPGSPPVTAWAKIETLDASDRQLAGITSSFVAIKVTIRYNAAFAAQKRIQSPSGNQYVILGIQNLLEMNAYLVLTCEGIGSDT